MKKYNQVVRNGKTVFVGIDLHSRSWSVTVISQGEVVFSGVLPSEPESLLKLLARYEKRKIMAVYEAGYFGFWLYHLLNDSGICCIVTPPSLVPMEYGNHVKTDRRDSKKLAELLSNNMLKAVWVPGHQLCAHRQSLRRRQQLISDRVRVQNRIKSELHFYGINIARPCGSWSADFVKQLMNVPLAEPAQRQSFFVLLEEYEGLCYLISQQTQLLKELAASESYKEPVRLLQTIPGIGWITAMYLLLELGDISRFPMAEQLAAYVGLTPSQYSSGDKIRLGRITKCGKKNLRAVLTEAAWTAIKKDHQLFLVYNNLKSRCGPKRAIIAVARRLLLRARRVILDNRPYCLIEAA